MGHLTILMRQKVENEIWRLNAYLYNVASTMEFCYLRTVWYMYMQSNRISEMLLWSLTATCNTSVYLTLKEFTLTAAKSCDKILIQNLYLSCRVQQHCQQDFLTR